MTGTHTVALRAARPEELPSLWELRTRAVAQGCAAHYPASVLASWLAAPAPEPLPRLLAAGGGVVAMEAGRLLGYAVLDAASGEVDAVFVEPAEHGRGIGALLLAALERMALAAGHERLFLSASLNAVPFYRHAGFQAIREESYPHRSGVAIASVYMEKQLG
ncbi:GNAT family N-acetyltransferase [Massilia haematophila]|uniref:GNAT family N-acetyltransferase n=2 Tax=Massilia TaxID=149698 RepID=A0ABV7PTU3_9BURK